MPVTLDDASLAAIMGAFREQQHRHSQEGMANDMPNYVNMNGANGVSQALTIDIAGKGFVRGHERLGIIADAIFQNTALVLHPREMALMSGQAGGSSGT